MVKRHQEFTSIKSCNSYNYFCLYNLYLQILILRYITCILILSRKTHQVPTQPNQQWFKCQYTLYTGIFLESNYNKYIMNHSTNSKMPFSCIFCDTCCAHALRSQVYRDIFDLVLFVQNASCFCQDISTWTSFVTCYLHNIPPVGWGHDDRGGCWS